MALRIDWLPKYTYTDYIQWEGRWEVIEGIPYAMSPTPNRKHQQIVFELGYRIMNFIKKQNISDLHVLPCIDYMIAEDIIVQPDINITKGDWSNDIYLDFAPLLVCEVTSLLTERKDLNLKRELYQNAGVLFYLIINPDKQEILLFELHHGTYEKREISDLSDVEFKFEGLILNIDLTGLFDL